ncbi:MAG: nucleotidyl transferase AbiEii/AbiGii toxin family protein [Verrucomicrobiota bacterium]|jgi:hypothetical protein
MNDVIAAALELQVVCQQHGWRFCFIGGIAVQRWSEPRFTDDADLTLLTGFGSEEGFIRPLLEAFVPRRPDAAEFALRYRVVLLKNSQGVGLDVALGAFPFEIRSIERSSPFVFPTGQSLITCSAEDLLVHKCFANRERDWLDVDGILARQWNKLKMKLVLEELKPLVELKEEPEILARLEKKIAHHNQPFTLIKPSKPRKKRR